LIADLELTPARCNRITVLDLYCERTGPGFWAEPVNAFTNVCFILVAWLSWRLVIREQVQDPAIVTISAMIVAIGIGSFLFHTVASRLTHWLDIAPVFVFQLLFLGLYSRRVIKLSWTVSVISLLLLLVAVVISSQFADLFNGSLVYIPALLAISILGAFHCYSHKAEPRLLLVAASLFLLSLFLRSIDIQICSRIELGTHFLWHILNAFVIYLAMRALIVNLSPATGSFSR